MNEHRPRSVTPDDDEIDLPSKTQIKKDMLALQELAVYVNGLKPEVREQLPLTDELRRAMQESSNIKKREALRRHHQYLGRLMRSADHEAISAALDKIKQEQDRLVRLMHVMEQWRDELITGDKHSLERFFEQYPAADRQALRNLIRAAQHERKANKAPASARKLFRMIRELVAAKAE